ncbi:hypothetical protein ACQB6R_14040 [Propionibacteriaceae bacterium G1746]
MALAIASSGLAMIADARAAGGVDAISHITGGGPAVTGRAGLERGSAGRPTLVETNR